MRRIFCVLTSLITLLGVLGLFSGCQRDNEEEQEPMIPIIENGQSNYIIVYSSEPTAAEKKPAESQNILQQIEEAKIKLIENCAKSVTKMIVKGEKFTSTGTGWCGYKNLIITNAHVVEDEDEKSYADNIECEFSDKLNLGARQRIKMKTLYYSREEDIAILTPDRGEIPKEVNILHISGEPTKQGELVFTIGNPLHYKFTYTEGAVANPDYKSAVTKGKFNTLQTTLTLNSGNSGGPVFNANGDVVGMATFSELKKETEQTLDPVAFLAGQNPVTEKTSYKEILGYGFCVKSEAILAAISSIQSKLK